MRILLVEDDRLLCRTLSQALHEIGHVAECAYDGASGGDFARLNRFDLVILDVMLPDKSGFDVCRSLRAQGINIPILMLTAKTTTEMKVQGLDSGADDYLCKPFEYDELFARIRALQRRQHGEKAPVIEFFGISMDTAARRVKSGSEEINLTATEYRILEYFMTNLNRLVTREMIEEHVWGAEKNPVSNAVDTLIKKIRHKLGWDPDTGPIRTIRGAGYRLSQ